MKLYDVCDVYNLPATSVCTHYHTVDGARSLAVELGGTEIE